MKKQQLSAVHRPLSLQTKRKGWFNNALNRFKYRTKANRLLSAVLYRKVVRHYALNKGLTSKTVFYFLFNRLVFSRKLKVK